MFFWMMRKFQEKIRLTACLLFNKVKVKPISWKQKNYQKAYIYEQLFSFTPTPKKKKKSKNITALFSEFLSYLKIVVLDI